MKTELRIGQSIFLIATSVGYKKITADAISNGMVLVVEQRFYRPTVESGSDNPFLQTRENDVTKFVEYESIKTVRDLNERGMVDIEVLEYNFDSNEYGDTVIEQEFVACSYNELQAIFDILKDDKLEAKKRNKILASLAIDEEEAKEIQSLVWLSEDSKLAALINKCAMTAFVINHSVSTRSRPKAAEGLGYCGVTNHECKRLPNRSGLEALQWRFQEWILFFYSY